MPDEPADDDLQLLRDYCATRAEPAFRALVERHLPAVWSAARRMVNGDAALAEDIAQEVFSHLAAYAPKLPPRVVLGGWLHRHTCFTARKALRTAARRRARELLHADAMTASSASDPWPDIQPHLDAALDSLCAADRDAVVLRYFEKRDFRSIAAALGTSEDAARMRTGRALEKLRGVLSKRSTLLTVALLTALMGEHSIADPPAGMAGHVSGAALARAGAVPAATGLALLGQRLRRWRAAILSGAFLLLSVAVVWQWNAMLSHPPRGERTTAGQAGAAAVKPAPQGPGPQVRDFVLHFLYVPEAQAAALMDARWGSDGDAKLLASLLSQVREDPAGVQLVRVLRGTCTGGQRVKLERVEEVPEPVKFEPGENGMITPVEFRSATTGTIAEIEMTVGEGGEWCDLNTSATHSVDVPEIQHLPTSLADPENKALPGARLPKFNNSQVNEQLMIKTGGTMLAQCSQLTRSAPLPAMRLLFFITVTQP